MSKKRTDAHARKLRSVAKRRKKEEQSIPYHVRTRRRHEHVEEQYAREAARRELRAAQDKDLEAKYYASMSPEQRSERDDRLRRLKDDIEHQEKKLKWLSKSDDLSIATVGAPFERTLYQPGDMLDLGGTLVTVQDTRTSAHEPTDALVEALNKAFKAAEDERRKEILGPVAGCGVARVIEVAMYDATVKPEPFA